MLFQAKLDVATAKRELQYNALRAAVSRAYYAMFYVASALLLEKGLSFSKHTAVVAAYGKNIAGKNGVPLESHRFLHDALDKRGIADYDFEVNVGPEVVKKLIEHAELFVEIGNRVLGDVSEHERGPN
ncbi:HEPN domain-containing protein [bacterium]|nr:HEPN domain-containing protein [bacterium]